MRQKLTQEIFDGRETAVSPIKTKRERLLKVWIANGKKSWRTRKRQAALRESAALEAEPVCKDSLQAERAA